MLLPSPLLAQQSVQDQLPEMGTAAQSTLSLEDEYRIGRMVMRGLRDSGRMLEDPEVGEYLQSLGLRLSSMAHDGNRDFSFFLIRDPSINAFALPGGFIGIHTGLLLETKNESELAAVLAHEVAHVTQRHIARGIEAQGRANLVSTAATLAAILIGAMAGGSSNATMGAVTAAQNLAVQSQINFTREHEYEADRVGIGILASAGYDPNAMYGFFETMGRRTQLGPDQVPELLRTHPVTTSRIAEAKGRALQYPVPSHVQDRPSYALIKERTRVLSTPAGRDPREYYASITANEPDASMAEVYGKALAQLMAGDAGDGDRDLRASARRASRSAAVPHRARPGAAFRRRHQGCARDAGARPGTRAAQRPGDRSLRRGADAGRAAQARARSAAGPVQQRAAVAGADPARRQSPRMPPATSPTPIRTWPSTTSRAATCRSP